MSGRPDRLWVILMLGLLSLGIPAAPPASAQAPAAGNNSLAGCPARKPVLRIAGVFSEEFSPHPVETRFASTHYTWPHQVPLFGVDPWEEKVDAKYGVAESWEFLPGARGMKIKLRQ